MQKPAGIVGFEPTNAGVKVLCLATWRYPYTRKRRRLPPPMLTKYLTFYAFICSMYCELLLQTAISDEATLHTRKIFLLLIGALVALFYSLPAQ